jgi:hypothetical protein
MHHDIHRHHYDFMLLDCSTFHVMFLAAGDGLPRRRQTSGQEIDNNKQQQATTSTWGVFADLVVG